MEDNKNHIPTILKTFLVLTQLSKISDFIMFVNKVRIQTGSYKGTDFLCNKTGNSRNGQTTITNKIKLTRFKTLFSDSFKISLTKEKSFMKVEN